MVPFSQSATENKILMHFTIFSIVSENKNCHTQEKRIIAFENSWSPPPSIFECARLSHLRIFECWRISPVISFEEGWGDYRISWFLRGVRFTVKNRPLEVGDLELWRMRWCGDVTMWWGVASIGYRNSFLSHHHINMSSESLTPKWFDHPKLWVSTFVFSKTTSGNTRKHP